MDKAEADITADYLQLPDWAREALVDGASRCSPGRAVWQVGNRMHLVEHIRSATESELTNTNRKMAESASGSQAPAAPLISMRKNAA
jgi:hypothetical protein